jgi:outer membrane protein OmpA-like peptidoglycan-associated protein
LEKVAAVVGAFPEGKVKIAGYTDSKGSPKKNLALSRERAQAVKDWLVKKKGLPGATITTEGFGEKNPIVENKNPDGSDNPVGRAQNRRVTITVEK